MDSALTSCSPPPSQQQVEKDTPAIIAITADEGIRISDGIRESELVTDMAKLESILKEIV